MYTYLMYYSFLSTALFLLSYLVYHEKTAIPDSHFKGELSWKLVFGSLDSELDQKVPPKADLDRNASFHTRGVQIDMWAVEWR